MGLVDVDGDVEPGDNSKKVDGLKEDINILRIIPEEMNIEQHKFSKNLSLELREADKNNVEVYRKEYRNCVNKKVPKVVTLLASLAELKK